MLMDSTKIFLLIVGNLLHLILSFIFFYFLRIFFDITVVGYYGTILSFFTVLSFINDLGFAFAYLKYYGESKGADEQAICNGTFMVYRIIQFGLYTIIMLIMIPITPIYSGDIMIIYLFFLGMIFLRVSFFEQILLSKKEAFKKSLSSILYVFLKDFLLILLPFYYPNTLMLLVYINLISNIFYFALNTFLIRNRRFSKPNKEYLKKFFKFSYPYFLTNSLIFIVGNIDVLLLNLWVDIDYVANYFTAKQFYSYFLIITSSISNILLTTFSKNISEGKEKENIVIIKYTHKILNLILIPIIFLMILYSTDLFVIIFGSSYQLTGEILAIFMILLIPISLDCVNIIHLQAIGKVQLIAKYTILENVFSIVLMLLFLSPNIFNLGVFGGALSYVIAKILIQLIYRPIIYRKYNLGFYWGSFKNLLTMVTIFFIQLWINIQFIYPVFLIPMFVLIDVVLYFSLTYLLKSFSKQDFKFIRSIINIKNVVNSIKTEMKE